jgi:DNA (cytosine-5)-methyltransferase 1
MSSLFASHTQTGRFRFIDLFAGIGGLRLALQNNGGECVLTCEIDKFARKTYELNFKDDHQIQTDVRELSGDNVPRYDVLCAGFPCQTFSLAGVSKLKSMGRQHGFMDETRGTLFFEVARLLSETRPRAFMLENVKNLVSHDKGKTFSIILDTLQQEMGYEVHWKVIDAKHFVPQHRERIVIVGFRSPSQFSWDDLIIPDEPQRMSSVLHGHSHLDRLNVIDGNRFFDLQSGKIPDRYTLSDKLWNYLQQYAAKHRAKGNGFGYGLTHPGSVSRCLSSRYGKDFSESLVYQGPHSNPRGLTPREALRLNGFPETFSCEGVSNTQLYRQAGNSVAVPVFQEVGRLIGIELDRTAVATSTLRRPTAPFSA